MAWRIDESVVRGEIDNRTRDRVTGLIWFKGRADPVILNLKGNPYRDLAGCILSFENPNPKEADLKGFAADQTGVVGDITASRKVFVLDCSIEESMRLGKAGKPIPKHQANCLYLEWYSRTNGRVVIETTEFKLSISQPVWTMTEAEERTQRIANEKAIGNWMGDAAGMLSRGEFVEEDLSESKPMDEFEWETFFKDSDRRTEKYGEVLEKYKDHPDTEQLFAQEMGWSEADATIEEQDRSESDPGLVARPADTIEEPELNPLTEGKDWVRDEHGHPVHPLYFQTVKDTSAVWHNCKDRGLIGEGADPCVQDMLFSVQICAAKMAGALNSLGYRENVDCGFVVAGLKRGLNYLHKAITLSDTVSERRLMDPTALSDFRAMLLKLREDLLALMDEHRRRFREQDG